LLDLAAALVPRQEIETMAEQPKEGAAAPAKKGGGGMMGMLVNGVGILVLTLVAVIAGGFINPMLHSPPAYKLDKDGNLKVVGASGAAAAGHGEGAPPAAFYYAIDPPLVVNFEENAAVRFLQISMTIMAKDQKAIDSVTKNMPLIRNNLLLLMSNRDYATLMTREGKEKLRQEALAEIRAVQKKQGGDDIEDLLFTSFVVQ
jgi:flagellar FliL protein